MTRLAKYLLFFSSFAPLFVLLAIRYTSHPVAAAVLGTIGVAMAAGGFGILEFARGGQNDRFVVRGVESRSESLAGYLIGYLFPFLVLDPSDTYSVAATALFGFLLAFTYVETNLLYLNPLLLLRGRHVWRAQLENLDDPTDRRTLTLLVNEPALTVGRCVNTYAIAGDVRVADTEDCRG